MRLLLGLAAAGLLAAATAQATTTAPVLVPGIYATNGIVTSVNDATLCGGAFIGVGGPVTSTIVYVPGSKHGNTLSTYGAFNAGGYVQHCTFNATFTLNGGDTGSCSTFAAGSAASAASMVSFTLSTNVVDSHTALGTATLSIPTTATAGAGCMATIATVLVYTGT